MELYWHTTKPSYTAFQTIPENRVYVSPFVLTTSFEPFLPSLMARLFRMILTRPELRLADRVTHFGASASSLYSAGSRSWLPMAISPTPADGNRLAMKCQA